MKKKMVSVFVFGLILIGMSGCSSKIGNAVEKPVELKDIKAEELTDNGMGVEICFDSGDRAYDSVQEFSYELFLQNIEEENPVLSPISAFLALAMAGNGAMGDTLEEFYDLLGNDLTVLPYDIIESLQRKSDAMNISLANSAWVDDQLTASNIYLDTISGYFGAEVYQRELSSNQAMKDMNIWVNAKTNGMIPCMINEPLDEDSRLVLFNTIYFKGQWKRKFKGYDTKAFDFITQKGDKIQTDMMQMRETDQLYVKNELAEGVILPYKDEDMVFLALMPVGETTVRDMYEQLTWQEISGFLEQEETTLCNLRLPKLEVSFEKELNESIKNMGLEKAFDSAVSDLSRIGTTEQGGRLYISLIKQKAAVILDEEGTEASAATMVEIKEECAIEYEVPPVNLFFDKPFLYLIIDKEMNIPLFMGILDQPK